MASRPSPEGGPLCLVAPWTRGELVKPAAKQRSPHRQCSPVSAWCTNPWTSRAPTQHTERRVGKGCTPPALTRQDSHSGRGPRNNHQGAGHQTAEPAARSAGQPLAHVLRPLAGSPLRPQALACLSFMLRGRILSGQPHKCFCGSAHVLKGALGKRVGK